ncbi:hypothetical protein MNEG_3383 [Monoraphidium neglectum]|uniref:Tyrosine-protein kinase ephrin type A/B receptor-like domain-containing protein n=1 Tax=Monoraphidium neglectum TaxID=145388 RepID=A0A0D2K1Z2_9CHLO|nr:hypothetical protein MNEG_3383 [Monoraphidium neglectum]KIZ04578.1 hypothetical protein MNEG_3383 [Monoraphidium neglectum]|eukprot:XP_013903597.1 hypothetical protein MNEG_3383 [Monoraphidium neglectum]
MRAVLASILLQGARACLEASILKAGDISVQISSLVMNDKGGWAAAGSGPTKYSLPTPGPLQYLLAYGGKGADGKGQALCLQSLSGIDPCRRQDNATNRTQLFGQGSPGDCFDFNTGATKLVRKALASRLAGVACPNSKDRAQGAVSTEWRLAQGPKGSLTLTMMEDKQQPACKGAKQTRTQRTETTTLKLLTGCLLGTTPPNCTAGVKSCRACGAGQVLWSNFDQNAQEQIEICLDQSATCKVGPEFTGCPPGFYGAAIAPKASDGVQCRPCAPGTFRSADDGPGGDGSASALLSSCLACPSDKDSGWAAAGCRPCPPGTIAKRNSSPLQCTPCVVGTYLPPTKPSWAPQDSDQCLDCPQGMYQDQAGSQSCKVCTTAWRCFPERAVQLGKFSEVPFRFFGPAGHPQCASVDGKTCLKNATCTDDKLQMVRDLEAAGQLKPLTCGPLHAAKWAGSTGYSEGPGHWCNVLLYDFLPAGAKAPAGIYNTSFWVQPPKPADETVTGADSPDECQPRTGW